MEPLMQLRANVRELTRAHTRLYEHDGTTMAGETVGLIQQLRDARGVSGDRAGSGDGTPWPLNAGPFQLLTTIEQEVRDDLKRWYVEPISPLEGAIQTWAYLSKGKLDFLESAVKRSSNWITQIKAIFEPLRRVSIKGDCPACGGTAADNGHLDELEQWVPVQPLSMCGDTVTCSMCGKDWKGDLALHLLNISLDTPSTSIAIRVAI